MKFKYSKCRKVLHQALMDALAEHREAIRALHQTEEIWAMSYDILPWDPYVGIAVRLESESDHHSTLNSGDWKHSHFIEDISCKALVPARDFAHQAYQSAGEDDSLRQDFAHLIFLAAAESLLDESVASFLQSVGIDVPVIGDKLPWSYFKFVVIDGDGVIKSNYCDIVCAMRATRRLLGKAV